jgi:1-acyl-sn-glycerol-3-phosphate acyltransferase
MAESELDPALIWPAAPSKHVARFFQWWLPKMFERSFHAVRLAHGTESTLSSLDAHDGPIVVVMNHQSWWDPLIAMHFSSRLTPSRQLLGPMELEQLKKFAFLRKLGVFGIDPDHPNSQATMIEYLSREFRANPKLSFWVTPQGQFVDSRETIRIRPGVANVAAKHQGIRVVALAVEMPFWLDKRPEILCRLCDVPAPAAPTTTGWTRAITGAMQANAEALATLVRARDEAAFSVLSGARGARVNPLYDLWLRLRGVSGRLVATDRSSTNPRAASADTRPSSSGRSVASPPELSASASPVPANASNPERATS